MTKAYVYNITPKGYQKGLTVCFNKKPTKVQMIDHIKKISNRTCDQVFRSLCYKCISGINTFGLIEKEGCRNMLPVFGSSKDNSKGTIAFKILHITNIEDDNEK